MRTLPTHCLTLLPALLVFVSLTACDTAPESLGNDAPPLPAGTRTGLLSLPDLAASAFEIEDDGTIWLGVQEIDLETYDPEGWSPGRLGHIDPDGEVSWFETFFEDQSYVLDIAAPSSGVGFLIRADPSRLEYRGDDTELLWSAPVDGFGHLEAIGPDLLLAGGLAPDDGGPRRTVVRRYAPSGEVLWETELDPFGPGNQSVGGLAVDEQGVVWVGGVVREDVLGRWWVARLDEDGVLLSSTVSDDRWTPESGYTLNLHGDSVIIASSSGLAEIHYLDAQGELRLSWRDEDETIGGQLVATPDGVVSLINMHDQPEGQGCMTPWYPCPDALVIQHLSEEGDVDWSARQEDCAWGVQSKMHQGALLVLSVCIENGTGARAVDLSRYAL